MLETHWRREASRLHRLPRSVSNASLRAVAISLAILAAGSCARPPSQTLLCHVQYADFVDTHAVTPATNPYTVPSVAVHGRFEFRAIYITEPRDLAGLNIYVYQTGTQAPELVHQLKLKPPYSRAAEGQYGITGLNLVYDERARELRYWCGFADSAGAR